MNLVAASTDRDRGVAERQAESSGRLARFRNEPECSNAFLSRIGDSRTLDAAATSLWLQAAAWKRGWVDADHRINGAIQLPSAGRGPDRHR